MLTKCIGIISWLPDKEPIRTNRKKSFKKLLKTLDTYFHLPIIIIAQNWREEDLDLEYNSNTIKIYRYPNGLGITKARVTLRDKLLLEDYDYFIFLDDDSDIKCTQESVDKYLDELDKHPDKFGTFKNRSWPRLLAISKHMLKIMNYNYIKNKEASNGEIWEDVAYVHTYRKLFPNKSYDINIKGLDEVSLVSRKDPNSTWYDAKFGAERELHRRTFRIIDEWVKHYKSE